jgi:signal transduction histidine kinase
MEGKSVRTEIDPAVQWISADERLIERIIANILSNAIKHSHAGGEVIIRVAPTEKDGGVAILTQDFGEGIPRKYHAKIFEKFCHAGLRDLGRKTDTGLGLAFCKMAVEAHGGSITVESAPGKGSRFTITLPGALNTE